MTNTKTTTLGRTGANIHGGRRSHDFGNDRAAAFAFMLECDAAGIKAGSPSLGAPYTITIIRDFATTEDPTPRLTPTESANLRSESRKIDREERLAATGRREIGAGRAKKETQ